MKFFESFWFVTFVAEELRNAVCAVLVAAFCFECLDLFLGW